MGERRAHTEGRAGRSLGYKFAQLKIYPSRGRRPRGKFTPHVSCRRSNLPPHTPHQDTTHQIYPQASIDRPSLWIPCPSPTIARAVELGLISEAFVVECWGRGTVRTTDVALHDRRGVARPRRPTAFRPLRPLRPLRPVTTVLRPLLPPPAGRRRNFRPMGADLPLLHHQPVSDLPLTALTDCSTESKIYPPPKPREG